MKKNNSGIFFGLFIIFIGIVLILSQFGMLDLDKIVNFLSDHISTIISLLLIVTGVNLVFDKYNGVKFFAWTAFFAVLLISGCIYGGATENKIERSTDKAYIRPFTEEKAARNGGRAVKDEAERTKSENWFHRVRVNQGRYDRFRCSVQSGL